MTPDQAGAKKHELPTLILTLIPHITGALFHHSNLHDFINLFLMTLYHRAGGPQSKAPKSTYVVLIITIYCVHVCHGS